MKRSNRWVVVIAIACLTSCFVSATLTAHRCDTTSECAQDAVCRNSTCSCLHGFVGDGQTCLYDSCHNMSCALNADCVSFPWYDVAMVLKASFRCVCRLGFVGNGTHYCRPGPCKNGRNNCSTDAICLSDLKEKNHKCYCKAGFVGDGTKCFKDLCKSNSRCTGEGELCVQSRMNGSVSCKCSQGYLKWNGRCIVDKCADQLNDCPSHSLCSSNSDGTFSCTCDMHYYKTEVEAQCVKHTCLAETHTCSVNAKCVGVFDPIDGFLTEHYKCVCNDGFFGDGFVCTAHPCETGAHTCGANSQCLHTVDDSYICECDWKAYKDSGRCLVHPCYADENVCSANTLCIPGSPNTADFFCYCMHPFVWSNGSCVAEAPNRLVTCADSEWVCPFSKKCISIDWLMDKILDCPDGEDENPLLIDFCATAKHDCDVHATCLRLREGGFNCTCTPPYVGDGHYCQKPPKLLPQIERFQVVAVSDIPIPPPCGDCPANATCRRDSSGTYSCHCNEGFSLTQNWCKSDSTEAFPSKKGSLFLLDEYYLSMSCDSC